MHVFWLALLMPICFFISWKFGGPRLSRSALFAAGGATIGLIAWMSVVGYRGFYETETIADRLGHAFQTLVSSINIPLVQVILGFLLMAIISFDFGKRPKAQQQPVELSDARA